MIKGIAKYLPTYTTYTTIFLCSKSELEYNPDFAVNLANPTAVLFIHITKDVIPLAMVEEIYNRTSHPKKLVVTDSLHTELYGTEPYITQAANEAIKWFNTYLVTSNTSATPNITNATGQTSQQQQYVSAQENTTVSSYNKTSTNATFSPQSPDSFPKIYTPMSGEKGIFVNGYLLTMSVWSATQ
jgi:hypothetical protein